MPQVTGVLTSADFCADKARERQRFYELLADVLLSIAAAERHEQAA